MKSRGFSPDAHYLKYVVKRYSWLALIPVALIGFHTWIGNMIFGVETASPHGSFVGKYYRVVDTGTALSDTITYASVLVGFLIALILFSFLWNKKENSSTLSLGVSLKNQFLIRYLFGAGMITFSYVLSFVLSYTMAMSKIGSDQTGLGIKYTVIYVLCLTLLALCVYTVFAICAILSGRFVDYLIGATGVIVIPYAIGQILHYVFKNFLHGSLLGIGRSGLVLATKEVLYEGNIEHITDRFGAFTAFDSVFDVFAVPIDPASLHPEELDFFRNAVAMPWGTFIITLILTAALAVFACIAFIRRPVEKTGMAGICPSLTVVASISISLFVSSFICELNLNRFLLMFIFSLLFALVFFILNAVCTAGIKSAFTHYPQVLATACTVWLCVLVCFFGAFGYSNHIPEEAEIEKVVMNYIGNPVILRGAKGGWETLVSGSSQFSNDASFTIDGYVQGLNSIFWWTYFDDMPALTSERDISKAIEIHKYVISEGMKLKSDINYREPSNGESPFHAQWYIVYYLKDGSRVERYYNYVTLSAAEMIASIEDSDAFRELYIENRLGLKGANVFEYGKTTFEIGDEFFSNLTALNMLTSEENHELFEALTRDFADLSYEDRYFYYGKVLGILRFAAENNYYADGQVVYGFGGNAPEDRGRDTWYITEKYTRTLDFLQRHSLTEYFNASMTVISVETQPYNAYSYGVNETGHGALLFIQSADNIVHTSVSINSDYDEEAQVLSAAYTQIPENEWQSYIERSRAIAATTNGGIIVRIIYKNSSDETKIIDRLIPNE